MGRRQTLNDDEKRVLKQQLAPLEEVREAIKKLQLEAQNIITDEKFNPDLLEHVTSDQLKKMELGEHGSKNRGKVQALKDKYNDRDFTKLIVAEVNLHNIKKQTLAFCSDLEAKLNNGTELSQYDLIVLKDAIDDLSKLKLHHYEYQDYEYRRSRGQLTPMEGAKHRLMGGLSSELIFTTGQLLAIGLFHVGFQFSSREVILRATSAGIIKPQDSVCDALENLGESLETSTKEAQNMVSSELENPSTLTSTIAASVLGDEQVCNQIISKLCDGIQDKINETGDRNITEEILRSVVLDCLRNSPEFSLSSSYLPNNAFPKDNDLIPAIADFFIAAVRNVTFTRLDFSYEAERRKQKLESKIKPKKASEHPMFESFKSNFIKSAHRQVYNALYINLGMALTFGAIKFALDNDQDKETQDKLNELVENVGLSGLWSVATGLVNAFIDASRGLTKVGESGQQLIKILSRSSIRGALQFSKGVVLDGKDVARAGIEAAILGVGSGLAKEAVSASIIVGKKKLELPVGKNPSIVAKYISSLVEMSAKYKSQAVVDLISDVAKTIPGNNSFEIVNPHRYETPDLVKPVYIKSPLSPDIAKQRSIITEVSPDQLRQSRIDQMKDMIQLQSVRVEPIERYSRIGSISESRPTEPSTSFAAYNEAFSFSDQEEKPIELSRMDSTDSKSQIDSEHFFSADNEVDNRPLLSTRKSSDSSLRRRVYKTTYEEVDDKLAELVKKYEDLKNQKSIKGVKFHSEDRLNLQIFQEKISKITKKANLMLEHSTDKTANRKLLDDIANGLKKIKSNQELLERHPLVACRMLNDLQVTLKMVTENFQLVKMTKPSVVTIGKGKSTAGLKVKDKNTIARIKPKKI